jgi:hypothetical protein
LIGRRGGARAVGLILVALVWSASPPVRAQVDVPAGRRQVVLFAPTADDPLAARLAAELAALGFQVTRSILAPSAAIEDSVRQALARGARTAVIAAGRRTEVWIAQDDSDRVGLRQELEMEDVRGLESILALRTVELMRVSLGLANPPPPAAAVAISALPAAAAVAISAPPPTFAAGAASTSAGPPPLSLAMAAARDRTDDRSSVTLAAGLLASSGRLGPFAVIGASLAARWRGRLGFELRAYAPLQTETVSDAGGEVRASVWLVGGGILLTPPASRRVSMEAGAGAMAAVLHAAGTGVPPEIGYSDSAIGVALYGRAALRARTSSRWSLRLDVMGGAAVRRPVIAVSRDGALDHDVTAWGKVFAAGLGGAEMRF